MQPAKDKNKVRLIKKVQAINNMQLTIVKNNTLFGLIIPAGISLIAVLGFLHQSFYRGNG